ncbi:unnamed protein product [Ranitomeya imitator]|uniref:CCAAT-binding factor domain-containing protein n=1 Tax=Ranitomeya imitator TaxID=111125 RepID=A0ABN9LQ41_9NEOB|nr:unnamed protein product [Ranitomeya imitator]
MNFKQNNSEAVEVQTFSFHLRGISVDLGQYMSRLNSNDMNIHLTFMADAESIDFLDVTIKRGPTGVINTDIFRKETSTNTLLHASSGHPAHMIRSIPVGQFLRLRRICSSDCDFEKRADELRGRFRERGYSVLRTMIENVWVQSRALPIGSGSHHVLRGCHHVYPARLHGCDFRCRQLHAVLASLRVTSCGTAWRWTVSGGADDAASEEDGFTLEEVLRLGGTKQDYIMLAGLEDTGEIVDGGKKGEIDDLEEGELKAFVEKLGFQKISQVFTDQSDDSTKLKEKEKKNSTKDKNEPNKVKKKTTETQNVKGKEDKGKPKVSAKGIHVTSTAAKHKGKPVFEFTARSTLLLKPGGKWYDHEYTVEYTVQPQNEDDVKKYKALAEKLYEHEVNLYKNKKELQKGANTVWMKTVVTTGTLADRMAAMTVLIQDAPVHTLQFVENLVNLARKKGSKRQNIMSLDTFKDLLQSDLLPDNRKLHLFAQHPFDKLEELSSGNRDARDRRLILWYFEEQLKQHVAEFVRVLETLTHDSLIATKAKSLNVIYELLCNKPEEEKTLLVLLVNKLGDPQYRVATKASYLLEMLLNEHPNMKVVVCLEVERLLYRPNISEKAQYYGICFLNQIIFSHDESDLANQLITVYFCFFRACIKKKEIDSKILRALLTGVNRAYPYAEIGSEKVNEQLETLFRILHFVKFNTGVQILMLLFQVMDSQQTVSNRYFSALYRKLLDPGLSQGSKQTMFLNLLFKSMKADVVLRRVKAFVKRLLQITCWQKPSFICGALYLISEIFRLKPGLKVLLHENGEDDEEEHFHDLPDDDDDLTDKHGSDTCNASGNRTSASWIHQESLQGKLVCLHCPW